MAEKSHSSHFSLSGMFTHAAIMLPFMVVTGGVMVSSMGLDLNTWNALSAGLDHLTGMFVDPIMSLPEFVSNFSWGGDLTYEWGMASAAHGSHGAAATHTAATHAVQHGAEHVAAEHVAAEAVNMGLSDMIGELGINLSAADMSWLEQLPLEDGVKAELAEKADIFGQPLQEYITGWCLQENITLPPPLAAPSP